ncbi:MAG: signal peptide peptidase SppA [Actinobacteria bacterium]|nr:signal peptide peptidase SppA [Actinomycetota bacterium]
MPDSPDQSIPPLPPGESALPGQMPPPPPPPPGFPVMLPMGTPKKSFISRLKDALVLIVFLGSLLLNLVLLLSVAATAQVDSGVKETVLIDGSNTQRIAVIDVKGIINDELAEQLAPQFKHVKDNDKYKALVLYVDSPGGGVTASDTIAHYVAEIKQTKKPVVVYMGSVAASGGYYISAPADYIMTAPTTITGSIGVIAQLPNIHGTLEKIGAQVVVIPSTPATKKALGSPFLSWDPASRGYFQELIDSAHQRFVEVVFEGRKKHFADIVEVEKLANGAALTATQALDAKLIDEKGIYFEDAVDKAAELAKLTKPKLIRISRVPSLREVLTGRLQSSKALINLDSSLLDSITTPRMLYLWQGQ